MVPAQHLGSGVYCAVIGGSHGECTIIDILSIRFAFSITLARVISVGDLLVLCLRDTDTVAVGDSHGDPYAIWHPEYVVHKHVVRRGNDDVDWVS